MNITQLTENYKVIPKTMEILNQIQTDTNKDIEIIITDTLKVDGLTKIARSTMDTHYIYINRLQLKHINYLLVHECGHIKRIYETAITNRQQVKSNPLIINMVKTDLLKESKHIPEQHREQILEYLINGLISQLVNAPVDAFIEKWIYNNFKELRNYQTRYLKEYSTRILNDITGQAKKLVPYSIFIKSNSLNYAYLKSIGNILNVNFEKHYNTNKEVLQTGKKLYQLFNVKDLGFNQDVEIINKCAEILNIIDWFYWDDFESIPDNYLQMNV